MAADESVDSQARLVDEIENVMGLLEHAKNRLATLQETLHVRKQLESSLMDTSYIYNQDK
jgi:hypothetical protein